MAIIICFTLSHGYHEAHFVQFFDHEVHLKCVACLLQLYINGEFVGGADIVEEMHTKGELKELLS
jgi:hypothetical protein